MVEPAHGSEHTGDFDDPLAKLRKVMKVVRQIEAVEPAGAGRGSGAAVPFVNQDQVEVALITKLATTQLAQTKQRRARSAERGGRSAR